MKNKLLEYITNSLHGYEQARDKVKVHAPTVTVIKRAAYINGRIDQLTDLQTIIKSMEE